MTEDSTATAPPLVLIHGSGGSAAVWRHQTDALTPLCRVVAMDLPGHGGRAPLATPSVDDYAADVEEQIQGSGLQCPIVGGHSLGGAIALTIALRGRVPIDGLILVGTGARLRVLPAILMGLLSDYRQAVEHVHDLGFSPSTSQGLVAESIESTLTLPAEVTHGDFSACDRFDAMTRLGEMDVPTLIVCGVEDRLTPLKYSEYFHRHIRESQLVTVERAGHFVQVEQPAAVNEAIRRFLRDRRS
ncbi:MAG: alpha/beta hydrolase [Chloroflexi bacterium]|nr:alpha/beta hydrolase [Chloroflexota bacterium]